MTVPVEVATFRLNDQFIEVDGLQDSVTLAYYSNGTLSATLIDQNGNPVAGLSNIPLAYISGSQGGYRGLFEQTFNPPLGPGYTLQITGTVPNGQGSDGLTDLFMEIPATVLPRTK